MPEDHEQPATSGPPFSIELAACAEMLFLDLPITERIRRIADLGFQVFIWDWTAKDIDALARTGARFSSMTGYVTGTLADEDGAAELLSTAEQSVAVAQKLGCPRLNLHGTGLDDRGLPVKPATEVTGDMWITAARTLDRIAALGERHGVTFMLENLNTAVDHPGVPFARAEDTLALVQAVDRPGLRMMLDLYHAQIGEGNLIDLLRRVGAVHRRDPGRRRPRPPRAGHRRDQLPGDREPRYARSATAARSGSRPGPRATASWRWNAFRAAFTAPPGPAAPPPATSPSPTGDSR